MAQIHEYPVTVTWQGGRDGSGSIACGNSGTTAPLAVGTEYQGSGKGTNPEELLTAGIAACYSMMFGIIAANRKLQLVDIKTEAIGEVEQAGMQFVYKRITLKPTITLEAGADDSQTELAGDIAHKAESYCIVTASVKGNVELVLVPTIVRS